MGFHILRRGAWRAACLSLFVLAAVGCASAPPPPAASAPASREAQAPGYYRQQVGALRVTALFDGVVGLTRAQIVGLDAAQVQALLDRRYVPEDAQGLQTAVNAYLVQSQGRVLLVDTGTAQCFGDGLGQVLRHLRAAGFDPAEVDDVLITHAHPDHLCGLLDAQGRAAYPRATVWLSRADADFWLQAATASRLPEPLRPLIGMARRAVAPYEAAGRLKRFAPADALPPGVAALPTPGHTPGHVSYLLDAGAAAAPLLVWGDVVHYHAVQLARPDASFEPDTDRDQAVASRSALLARAADQGWWVAGAHMPFPGLGHVRREGGAYAWVPAEYAPLRP